MTPAPRLTDIKMYWQFSYIRNSFYSIYEESWIIHYWKQILCEDQNSIYLVLLFSDANLEAKENITPVFVNQFQTYSSTTKLQCYLV